MKTDRLDEIIEQALLDPFHEVLDREGPSSFTPTTQAQPERTPANSAALSEVLSDFSTEIFHRPIELVLRPHASVAQIILTRIYQARTHPETMTVIERYGSDLVEKLEEIRRYYRVFVETSSEDLLEKEAARLVKRFFQDNPNENQKDFIKLKRFYEKIRSFQDIVDEHWNDVQKLIDTFSIINETRHLVKDLPDRYLPEVNSLLRRTALFLLHLKEYAKIEDQSNDAITGNLTVRMVYDPKIRYTVEAALRSEEGGLEELLKRAPESDEDEEEEPSPIASIARNIVLESRSRRFHHSSYFAVPLLGSRDWNRSPHYSLEIGMIDYEEERRFFEEAFHIILSRDDMEKVVQLNSLVANKGSGATRLSEYTERIIGILDETADRLLDEDFPGIPHQEVFLYHIGPRTFCFILMNALRTLHIGDIFYVNSNSQIVRMLPEFVLQKLLIDWWIERFEDLDIEAVDSYLSYSRNLETLRSEFLLVFERARDIRRQEEPGASYRTFDDWLRKHRHRIFGVRRYEIFRRFFPDLLFNMNEEN
ncbi:MAG: hypothetical protein F9K24_07535 [Leptonema illini]|uniref:Uncharacterized protein n=1 Tax=Leptonema illini TaxID=183 RepID=A0A833LXH4_9LEPT|nr:MAG: hypothetical protein F9K24_07535 [Leptonema illini]